MAAEAMQQLSQLGGNLMQPYTQVIVQLFAGMQAQIDFLQQRIAVLEGGNGKESTSSLTIAATKAAESIAIPKSDKKYTKSAPVTPTTPSKRKKKSESKRASTNSIRNKKQKETQILKEVAEESKEIDNVTSENEILDTSNIEATPITKERGDKRPLRYVFQSDHNIIKQSNNGAGAIKPKFKPGTIRFGKFVSKEENNGDYASYIYKFDTASMGPTPSGYAFGVCNKSFSNWTTSNFGDNGCVMIKGNGQYITTDGVFTSDNKDYIHKKIIPEFQDGGVFGEGDIVAMEIDVENLELSIWNETRNDGKIFKVKIPNRPLAPIVYMGGSAKRKIMVSEQCAYKYINKE